MLLLLINLQKIFLNFLVNLYVVLLLFSQYTFFLQFQVLLQLLITEVDQDLFTYKVMQDILDVNETLLDEAETLMPRDQTDTRKTLSRDVRDRDVQVTRPRLRPRCYHKKCIQLNDWHLFGRPII